MEIRTQNIISLIICTLGYCLWGRFSLASPNIFSALDYFALLPI